MTETCKEQGMEINREENIANNQNTSEKGGGKLFTQSQLDAIVAERIERERRGNEAVLPLKRLLRSVGEKGLENGLSYADIASRIMEKLGEGQTGDPKIENLWQTALQSSAQEKESYSEQNILLNEDKGFDAVPFTFGEEFSAEQTPKDAEGGQNDMEANAENSKATVEKTAEGSSKTDMEIFISALSHIQKAYGDGAGQGAISSELFSKFARGKSGSAEEIFAEYCDFLKESAMAGATTSEKREQAEKTAQRFDDPIFSTVGDRDERQFYSTAFSSLADSGQNGYALTKTQMEMAKSAGLTYREYAELLESIPKKNGIKV